MSAHEQKEEITIAPEARDLYKQANQEHADEQESMGLLRSAAEISPDFYQAHLGFARSALAYGRKNYSKIDQAKLDEIKLEIRKSLDRCVDLRPELAAPYALSACIAYLSHDHQRGIVCADKALEIDGDNFEALLYKGGIYLELAKEDLSKKNFEGAQERAKQAQTWASRARAARPGTFEAVHSLADAHECLGHARLGLGEKEASHQSFEQALVLYTEAAGFSLSQEHYSEQMAHANLHCGRMMEILLDSFGPRYSDRSWRSMQERIIKHMTAAIGYKPDYAWAYRHRAMARISLRRFEEARVDLTTAQKHSDDPGLQEELEWLDVRISARDKADAKTKAARAAREARQAARQAAISTARA